MDQFIEPLPRHWVLLLHEQDNGRHYDFLVEQEEHLEAWKLFQRPLWANLERFEIESSFSHRKHYLDYQGEISENRGYVHQVSKGVFSQKNWGDRFIKLFLIEEKNSFRIELSLTKKKKNIWLWESKKCSEDSTI